MPTIDDLDTICVYIDDKERFKSSIYRSCKVVITPRAERHSKVTWIMKGGELTNEDKAC